MGRPPVEATDVFRALADPTRRVILSTLRDGGLAVADIASAFPVSRPAVSKHLRILKEADLVVEQRLGRNRVYALNAGPLQDVDDWLDEYRTFWRHSLRRLKDLVEISDEASRPRKTRKGKSERGRKGQKR